MALPQPYEALKQSIRLYVTKDGNQHQALAGNSGVTKNYFSYLLNTATDTKFSTFLAMYKGIGKDPRLLSALILADLTPEDVEMLLDFLKKREA